MGVFFHSAEGANSLSSIGDMAKEIVAARKPLGLVAAKYGYTAEQLVALLRSFVGQITVAIEVHALDFNKLVQTGEPSGPGTMRKRPKSSTADP